MLILTSANIPLLMFVVGKFGRERKRLMVSLKSSYLMSHLYFSHSAFVKLAFTTQFYILIVLRLLRTISFSITSGLCVAIELRKIACFSKHSSSSLEAQTSV